MVLQSLVRWLLPKEEHFFDFLEQQAEVADQGANALASLRDGSRSVSEVRQRVQELEHQGDKLVHEMEEALARTFVTPIDREDLQKLSKELDDILDLTNLAARSCVLFGVEKPSAPMIQLMEKLIECTTILKRALPRLRQRRYADLIHDGRAIHSLEKEGDTIFRDGISVLFHDPSIDAKVLLREKDILEDLENAIDHCDHIASTLTNLAIKNG